MEAAEELRSNLLDTEIAAQVIGDQLDAVIVGEKTYDEYVEWVEENDEILNDLEL
jgi:hypothetical protein